MAYFYRNSRLHIGADANAQPVADVLAQHASTTPVYLYDLDDITMRVARLNRALSFATTHHTMHYAMKANSNRAILRELARLACGVDTVSGGEIKTALDCGFTPNMIIFSGVGKTVRELEFAIQNQIKQINIESPQELDRIAQIARRLGQRVPVALRLNPDVDAKTHPYITTGFRENKFGMDESFMPEVVTLLKANETELELVGLTMHIGSQITELSSIFEAVRKTLLVFRNLQALGFRLTRLDIGGGVGVHYDTDDTSDELSAIDRYGQEIASIFKANRDLAMNLEILSEPGRILVARSGLLIGEVQYIKRAPQKTFAILDTGMNHLIRPALYGAKHRVLELEQRSGAKETFDVVGPICESADFLAKDVSLTSIVSGDLIAIADAGAYGFSMASRYNSHAQPTELVWSQIRQQAFVTAGEIT
jgi:diaminopimelate decarboxylase